MSASSARAVSMMIGSSRVRACARQRRASCRPRLAGQHPVEHHEVGQHARRPRACACVGVGRDRDLEAGVAQVDRDQLGDRRLVLDDQDPAHRLFLGGPRCSGGQLERSSTPDSAERLGQPLGAALRLRRVPASTITRSTGSVPDGADQHAARCRRARARRRPARRPAPAFGLPVAARRRARTLISVCGNSVTPSQQLRPASCRCARTACSTCSALTMPSPVVCLSSASRWPEPSPPSSQPRADRAPRARSGRRPWRARTRRRAARSASSTAMLVISVPTTPGTGSPCARRSAAIT